MRVLLSAVAALFLIGSLGCSGKALRSKQTRGALNEKDYQKLKDINQILVDNEDAMRMVSGPGVMVSGKAEAIKEALKNGGCRHSRDDEPNSNFGGDWDAAKVFEGSANCPVRMKRTWHYNWRNRELVMTHMFNTTKAGFNKENGIDHYYGSGSLAVFRDSMGATTVSGDINYDQFTLTNYGNLKVEIRTRQSYRGAKGTGVAEVRISKTGDWSYTGSVTWDARDFSNRMYYADGGQIDQKNFLEIFSFFNLDKIVDDSERMR